MMDYDKVRVGFAAFTPNLPLFGPFSNDRYAPTTVIFRHYRRLETHYICCDVIFLLRICLLTAANLRRKSNNVARITKEPC